MQVCETKGTEVRDDCTCRQECAGECNPREEIPSSVIAEQRKRDGTYVRGPLASPRFVFQAVTQLAGERERTFWLNQQLVAGTYDGQSQNCATFVLTVGP